MHNENEPYQFLGPVDTAFLHAETLLSPMNIGSVTIFEGKIPFDAFVQHVDARLHQAPLYQKRLMEAPLNIGQPAWVFDPDFYIGKHVFRLQLDKPGTVGQLREVVGKLVSRTLPRDKPLWEIYMIEGLENDQTAVFFKVHHSMVDGLSAVELFTILFDLTPFITEPMPKPLYSVSNLPDTLEHVKDVVLRDLPYKWGVLTKLAGDVAFFGATLTDREKRRKMFRGIANLLSDNLRTIRPLAINGKNTGNQILTWVEFPLAEVRAIRSQLRASVNDVMLTILGGAIDRYEHENGNKHNQPFLRALIPVNMRMEQEKGEFGNRISVLPIDIPLGMSDPLERLQAVVEYSQTMKQSHLSNGVDMLLTLPALAPAITQPIIWSLAPATFAFLAHTWCTNVSGPQIPVYLLGHEMRHSYGFFPLNPSMGMACVVLSYNQKITMTLVTDNGIIPDPLRIKALLEASFLELRKAAKVEPIEPIQIERAKTSPPPEVTPVAETKPPVAVPTPEPIPTSTPLVEPIPPQPAAPPAVNVTTPPPVTATMPVAEPAPQSALVATAIVEPIAPPPPVVQSASNPDTAPPAHPEERVNGADKAAAPETIANPSPAVTADAHVNGRGASKHKLFSESWAQAFQQAINASDAYRKVSLNWQAGSLAFVMKAAPAQGFLDDTAVLMDLHKGVCRSAHSLPAAAALQQAAFVIEGDHRTWLRVLGGAAPPLIMLMRGDLHLKKGSLIRLLPFTQSAQELLHSAQRVPWE